MQSLSSVLASSEYDASGAGWSPVSAQKTVSFPKDSNYSTSSTNFHDNGNNDICHRGGAYYMYQHCTKCLYFVYLKSNYFLSPYYVPGSVLGDGGGS